MFTFYRLLNSSFFPIVLLLLFQACTTDEGQFMDPMDANLEIAASMLLKDQQCGTGHVMTVYISAPARKSNVAACGASILSSTCYEWEVNEVLPASCLSIQMGL